MSNELLTAAQVAAGRKNVTKYIKENGIKDKRDVDFVMEYINNGGNATQAYLKISNNEVTIQSAGVLGCRILKRVAIDSTLDMMGLGMDSMKKAMTSLLDKDPNNYMKYWTMLNKLDEKNIKLSGEIKMPNITVYTGNDIEKE